jgi:hypothetical protein
VDEKTLDFLKNVFFIILGAAVTIGGIAIENNYYEQSLESELAILDVYIERVDNIQNLSGYTNLSLNNADESVLNYIETNITFVSSVYSKYPLRIVFCQCPSEIDNPDDDIIRPDISLSNSLSSSSGIKVSGLIDPSKKYYARTYAVVFPSRLVYPSDMTNVNIGSIVSTNVDLNSTVSIDLVYYDPATDKKKEIKEDICVLHFINGSVTKITPLKEYVRARGYSGNDHRLLVYY